MRSWDLSFALDRTSSQPLALQLVAAVVQEIRRGRFAPGEPLPGSRGLALSLGVHRNTVVAAFDELRAQGWLETTRASHTRVTRTLPVEAPTRTVLRDTAGYPVAPWGNSARAFEAVPANVLDFSGGLPDARLFPAHLLARAYRRALRKDPQKLLGFGNPAGDELLRRRLAQMLASRRGLAVGADDLLITRGSQLALHLLSLALVRREDTVAVENPGYPSAREAFSLLGAKLLPVPVDAHGLDVAALRKKLKTRKIRALYLTPHHHDPTTVTLSAQRRLELMALAHQHRFAIIEADYDYEFQYEGAPVLPMASDDPHRVVIYVGTLSKALAPGLRMGFVAAPRQVLKALLAVRGQVDRTGDSGVEHALAELLEDGEVLRHSLRARRVFHARRDTLVGLLSSQLSGVLSFEVPHGGLALWAKVSPKVDVEVWARESLKSGVRFFTGRQYSPGDSPLPFVRLGFGHLNEDELRRAVKVMAKTVGSARSKSAQRKK